MDAIPSAAERAHAQRELTASRDELLDFCATLPPGHPAWQARLRDDSWTVAGILEHLTIVEQRVGTLMQAMLAQPPDPNWRELTAGKEAAMPALAAGAQKITAPPVLHPQGRPVPELLAEYRQHRDTNLALASRDDLPLKHCIRNHPALGPLNGYQWLLITASHTRRHLAQMREAAAKA